ncbi:respiratory nitrate reductase subunit gamma, partial [Streptomyces roseolus]|uniref:respiratory nitrate reductase subunit gamma n=1 Tax=Streptomyces roseolus TaxID=67358 RepID=UPI00365283D2
MNYAPHLPTELWLILPYVAFTSFVLGHLWRYRNDQFGWTTRSSQIYESRLLRLGSPLFHFGMVGVFGGHVLGVLIPQSWTDAIGISEHAYHLVAVGAGSVAGLSVLAGVGILLYRRITTTAVRKATTGNDKLMYVLLTTALVTGLLNTWGSNLLWGTYNYRDTVSPWFRSLFTLNPQPELMVDTPWTFQAHGLIVLTLIGLWPYTRLVHMFSAPVGYLTRPY